ncbi:MAG: MarR family transcriptional regulator for hemolysin, partial [Pirellulaceae bacterium]
DHDLDDSVGVWITFASDAYRKAFTEEVAPYGFTFRQCQVLGYLAYDGPLPQIALAERMRVEPPTLVGILDRMERDGWIERVPSGEDRRKKLIHPTKMAQPIWKQILKCGRRVRARATAGLSARQLEQLREMLLIVQNNLVAPQRETNRVSQKQGT